MKAKVTLLVLLLILLFPIMTKSQVKVRQTAGRDALGEFAPEFARLNDDILYPGAAPNSWFSHLAIAVPGENNSNEWLELVSDEEYLKLK